MNDEGIVAQPVNALDQLPVRKGFRMRGMATTRLETFTDAAFAFALTLLVLASDIPTSYDELMVALGGVPAFIMSATLLMMFWTAHHSWSRRYGLEDVPAILISCLLVFTVLVYVYPLRFLFNSMMEWLSYLLGVPSTGPPVSMRPEQVNSLFVVYGIGFIAMCGSILLLNIHSWRRREALQLDELECFDTRTEIEAWSIVGGVGVLSTVLALLNPPTILGLPGWTYSTLAVIMPLHGRRVQRRRDRLRARLADSGE